MPSFPTALTVAVDQGRRSSRSVGEITLPSHTHNATKAVLAVSRSQATEPGCVSLSPATIRRSSGIERLVLPSPNGSTIFSKPCCRRLARDRGVTQQRRRRSGPALDDLQLRTDPQIHQAMLASVPATAATAAAGTGLASTSPRACRNPNGSVALSHRSDHRPQIFLSRSTPACSDPRSKQGKTVLIGRRGG
jgi:hypothetical protein